MHWDAMPAKKFLLTSTFQPPGSRQPIVCKRDIGLLGLLPSQALLAWSVPERRWQGIAARLARSRMVLKPGRTAREVARIRRLAGRRLSPLSPEACLEVHLAHTYLERLQLLHAHHPRGWRPQIRLEGRRHIEDTLASGNGAILWIAPFVYQNLVTKMAFHQAGYALAHLYRYTHSLSDTRFGVRVLNPIVTTAEDRFLSERLVIGPDGSTCGVMGRMLQRLQQNQLVSVAVGAQGAKTANIPFMAGQAVVATGALSLISRTGAALLPIFTVREPSGAFVVTVESPLRLPACSARGPGWQELLAEYAAILTSQVERWPDQFLWFETITDI
jgi:lauroyl/myristoyl acyltransferase